MTKNDLINEFNNTKTICGIPISADQQRALKYAAIRLEELDGIKMCHMKKSYQGQSVKDITICCSECHGHLGSTANAVKHFAKFCKNCGAVIDFTRGVEQ